jgi:hypothetical protein
VNLSAAILIWRDPYSFVELSGHHETTYSPPDVIFYILVPTEQSRSAHP